MALRAPAAASAILSDRKKPTSPWAPPIATAEPTKKPVDAMSVTCASRYASAARIAAVSSAIAHDSRMFLAL